MPVPEVQPKTFLDLKKSAETFEDIIRGRGKSLPLDPELRKNIKKIKTGYVPRKIQLHLHQTLRRFNVMICHRRFGKTVLAVNQIIHRAICNPLKNPQYAYIAPTYKQAKLIAWQYFVDYTRHLPNVKANKSELTIYIERPDRICPLTGEKDPDVIKLMLIGADDPDAIRGLYLDGGAIDEFAQCDPIIWGQIIRPALADRKKIAREMGIKYDWANNLLEPWIIFIGTPKGQNHFYRRYQSAQASEKFCREYEKSHDLEEEEEQWADLEKVHGITYETSQVELKDILEKISQEVVDDYKRWRKYSISTQWFTAIYKASETGILALDEIEEMIEDLSKEEVEQELECSFTAAILGSYYGHLLVKAEEKGQICDLKYDPRYPVETFWDLGVGDKCTIWFRQKIGGKYHYIDYYENNGKGVQHYIKVLDAKASWDGKETEVDENEEMVLGYGYRYGRHIWPHDGKVQEFGSGQSRQETARKQGLTVFIQPKQRIDDRINATRDRIKISYFDKEKCARGIECLYNYQKEFDSKLMVFKKTPKHDWSSHASDSFGYSALDDRDFEFQDVTDRYKPVQSNGDYDELEY